MSTELNIQAIYDYAKLANFAYVDLSRYLKGELKLKNIVDEAASEENPGATARIPKVLAKQMFAPATPEDADFTGTWTLLDPYFKTSDGTGHSDPASGFAAMLLENDTYGKVLAIAGTEPSAPGQLEQDLLDADLTEIREYGIAFKQLVSLYNYVQVLRGAQGELVDQLVVRTGDTPPAGLSYLVSGYEMVSPIDSVKTEYIWLEKAAPTEGLGLLSADDKLTVVGHNLGGHLSSLAVALFPDLFTLAVSFNAPGYDGALSSSLFGSERLLSLFSQFGTQPVSVTSISEKIITYESEDAGAGNDWSAVAGDITGTPFSPEKYIMVEENSHNFGAGMDGLALQALFYQLDKTLQIEETNALIKAVTSKTEVSYELLLKKLYKLIIGSEAEGIIDTFPSDGGLLVNLLPIGDGNFEARSSYYGKLIELSESDKFKEQAGKVTVKYFFDITEEDTLDPYQYDDIVELAKNNIAYRYALVNLNPFAIIGNDDIYSKFNQDGELDIFSLDNPKGQLSEQYLKDRANFLIQLLYENIYDLSSTNFNPADAGNYMSLPVYYYADFTTGIQSLKTFYTDFSVKDLNP